MKQYNFEYTRQGFAYLLLGISFAIIGLGLVLFPIFLKSYFSPGLAVIVIIGLAVAFFWVNKGKIKRLGSAKLSSDELIVELDKSTNISFTNVKYYYVYNGKNGIVFTLGFKDETKFKLGANNNFCNEDYLKVFLDAFQSTIENYNEQNKAGIIHLETIFAKKQSLYILSILTILVILGFCFTKMPLLILPIGVSASLLVGWIRYFQQRSKNKLVDF